MTFVRFATVVMDRGQREHWREKFIEDLARGQTTIRGEKLNLGEITLHGDELRLQGEWMGSAQFAPLESAASELATWITAGARPFVGSPAGLFLWSHTMANASEQRDIVSTLVRAARGAGYRIDTHELRENVVRRVFSLTETRTPYGFEEGTALLEHTPGDYTDDIVAAIRRTLSANQIDIWSGLDPDTEGNNPVRLYPPMHVAGELISNERVDSFLYPLDIEIWSFPEKLGDPRDEFWLDA